MEIVSAGEFKAKCLKLMDVVANTHEEFVITKHGIPIAKMVPIEQSNNPFGVFRGKIKLSCDLSTVSNVDNWHVDHD